ncbi:hypothetical protein RUND412_007142 [Rhizina undulata]
MVYSAHCEKQIVVPNTGILYCSEKCRRKDQSKPPHIPIAPSSCPSFNPSWATPPLTPDGPPLKNYVEPFSPTPPRSTPTIDEDGYFSAKPSSIANQSYFDNHMGYATYRSGQTTPTEPGLVLPTINSNIYMPPRRPMHLRTLTGSSIATAGSNPPPTSNYTTYPSTTAQMPTQYQLNQQRPLPPLHKPYSYSSSPRSIDLVTPYIVQPEPPKLERSLSSDSCSSGHLVCDGLSAGLSTGAGGQSGNMKTLFNFEAIRANPLVSTNPTPPYSRAGTASPMSISPNRSQVNGMIARTNTGLLMRGGGLA